MKESSIFSATLLYLPSVVLVAFVVLSIMAVVQVVPLLRKEARDLSDRKVDLKVFNRRINKMLKQSGLTMVDLPKSIQKYIQMAAKNPKKLNLFRSLQKIDLFIGERKNPFTYRLLPFSNLAALASLIYGIFTVDFLIKIEDGIVPEAFSILGSLVLLGLLFISGIGFAYRNNISSEKVLYLLGEDSTDSVYNGYVVSNTIFIWTIPALSPLTF